MALRLSRFLADEQATALWAEDIALALKPGDCLLLSGDLGAGKTTLARAIIRTLCNDPLMDVPSPTFTLVQAYDGRVPVAHFDLYRIAQADELDELGLDEALLTAAALVEWPERAEGRLPAGAIQIRLEHEGGGRRASLEAGGPAAARLERSFAIRAFLEKAGKGPLNRSFLLGDASSRTYELASIGDAPPMVVMNAPRQPDGPPIRDGKPYSQIAHLAESVTPFVAVDKALRAEGFCAPEILAADLDQGLLLTEHLGTGNFLDPDGNPVAERYEAAAVLLARLHGVRWPRDIDLGGVIHHVPDYDPAAMMIEAELALDWYFPAMTGRAAAADERAAFSAAWAALITIAQNSEQSLVLRDYHSPNLIWRPERRGEARLGIIDFQDAMIGPSAYDVASLAQDARVTVSPELEQRVLKAYCAARKAAGQFDRPAFDLAYAIMAAQRNSKILGIFVRLDRRDAKPHYLRHLPRIRAYTARALAHPALSGLKAVYDAAGLLNGPEGRAP